MSEMIDMSEGAMRRILNDRIEELEAKLARYNHLVADKIDLQSENIALKAKLAKAVEAMSEALGAHDQTEAEWTIKDALAELTRGKDG